MLGSTITRKGEESFRERSQGEMCKMKGERHLYIGGVPRDRSTKGAKKLNKKIK